MSPDTVSSLFPERPIRPLPKRRLRERLSPDVADAIQYPPANQNSSPLFYYPPYTLKEESSAVDGLNTGSRSIGFDPEGHHRSNGGNGESDEEELALRSTVVRRAPPEILSRNLPPKTEHIRHTNPQPPPSTTSSADGYDSFENTNNKKKRKIPTAGDTTLNGSHSLGDINSLSISATTSPSNDHGDLTGSASSPYYGSSGFVSNNQGISGPGRGRFGRARNGRSPLRALSDATNNWAGRGAKIRPPQWASPSNEKSGIISSAIANAEKISNLPGQENISLLQHHSATSKSSPASTQFTFTCDSQVPGTQWPGTGSAGMHPPLPSYMGGNKTKQSMATQTSATPSTGANNGQPATATQGGSAQGGSSQAAPGSKKKSRRRAEKELRIAAKHRRQQAEYDYYHNPPKIEDMWICEFCEYERIFGEPPHALIRQYEIKDQKVRRQEEERKRLLEKAKAKNRKGKKTGKSPTKGNSTAPNQAAPHGGLNETPMAQGHSHSTQEGDYVDDEFEGSYSQDDPPMLLSDDPDEVEHDGTCPTCGDCIGHGHEGPEKPGEHH